MPSKRPRTTKKSKKANSQENANYPGVSAEIAREIAAAVERVPEKVMSEYRSEEPKKSLRMVADGVHRKKQKLLFTGVGVFIGLIILMWGWNARTFITDAFSHTNGENLFPKTRRDISSFFEKIDQTQELQTVPAASTTNTTTALNESFTVLFGGEEPPATGTSTTSSLATTSTAVIR